MVTCTQSMSSWSDSESRFVTVVLERLDRFQSNCVERTYFFVRNTRPCRRQAVRHESTLTNTWSMIPPLFGHRFLPSKHLKADHYLPTYHSNGVSMASR